MAKCTCIEDFKNPETEIGKQLLDALQNSNPDAVIANIHSTVFWLDDGIPASVALKYESTTTSKKGKETTRTKGLTIRASYCPICGLDKDGNPAAQRNEQSQSYYPHPKPNRGA